MITHRSSRVAAAAAAAVFAALSAPAADAAPMDPTPLTAADADGTPHQVILHGDEFISWISDLEGYPVEKMRTAITDISP